MTNAHSSLPARFHAVMKGVGMEALIANLTAEIATLDIGPHSLPTTLSDRPDTCYICAPTAAYIDYALAEIRNFQAQPLLHRTLKTLITACRPLLRATGLDSQIQPNNWLFSTNPVPTLSQTEARTLRDTLSKAHPTHAIVLRSLNEIADGASLAALKAAGFTLLPARQIYIFDGRNAPRPTGHQKRDAALLRTTSYKITTTFTEQDFQRAEHLYNRLYLEKYTALNPHYTALFLQRAHAAGLLRFTGLRAPSGQLDGIVALFENGQTLTHPIIGYDTALPQKLGLYRMLSAIAQDHALEAQKFFNMSAGAAQFKRNRGAVPAIEYTAVYVTHLRWRKRLATTAARMLLSTIGIPLLKRFEL